MVPYKAGKANEGHSCVKGRFAYGYATHKDRITKPMIRKRIEDPWREVSWDEALALRGERVQAHPGRVRPRLDRRDHAPRAAPTRRCSSFRSWCAPASATTTSTPAPASAIRRPAMASAKTFGTSAGTQDFKSVDKSDVILVIGANPTDAHPVFASRMKRRLRAGAKLIVIDPRRIDLVRTPACRGRTSSRRCGPARMSPSSTRWRMSSSPRASSTRPSCASAAIAPISNPGRASSPRSDIRRRRSRRRPASSRRNCARRRGSTRPAAMAAIYYGLGVTEHAQGSTTVMAMANLAMATGNIGRDGVGVNPLRGQNNVQGSCDMGSFPHEFSGYRHVSDDATREMFERLWGVAAQQRAGPAHPQHDGRGGRRRVQGPLCAGRGHRPVRSRHAAHHRRAAGDGMRHRAGSLPQRDRALRACLPARRLVPRKGRHLHQRRAAHQPRAQGDRAARRQGRLGDDASRSPRRWACRWTMRIRARSWTRSPRRRRPSRGVSYARLDELGSIQWPCNDEAPTGTPIMHVDRFVRGKGQFMLTEYVATEERVGPRFPLLLTTGRILSQYNVGAQTRRTANTAWHDEDVLEIHPFDAEKPRRPRRRSRRAAEPRRRDRAARQSQRAHAAGRRLHDLPPCRSPAPMS